MHGLEMTIVPELSMPPGEVDCPLLRGCNAAAGITSFWGVTFKLVALACGCTWQWEDLGTASSIFLELVVMAPFSRPLRGVRRGRTQGSNMLIE